MSVINNQIKFYKECYESDHKGYSLLNFFKNSSSHHIFIEKEELLTLDHPKIPIDKSKASEFLKHQRLNESEKEVTMEIIFAVMEQNVHNVKDCFLTYQIKILATQNY